MDVAFRSENRAQERGGGKCELAMGGSFRCLSRQSPGKTNAGQCGVDDFRWLGLIAHRFAGRALDPETVVVSYTQMDLLSGSDPFALCSLWVAVGRRVYGK